MINRALIRIRVLQSLFEFRSQKGLSYDQALENLEVSIANTYDLYLHLITLIPNLVDFQRDFAEELKSQRLREYPVEKLLPICLANQLRSGEIIEDWESRAEVNWRSNDIALKSLLIQIIDSDIFQKWSESERTYEDEKKFWFDVYLKIIFPSDLFEQTLAEGPTAWDDTSIIEEYIEVEDMPMIEDVDEVVEHIRKEEPIFYKAVNWLNAPIRLVQDFVGKTIKKVGSPDESSDSFILSPYKDPIDKTFAKKLFKAAYEFENETQEFIEKFLDEKGELDRLSLIDTIVMNLAVAEINRFDSIPIPVTVNEYVELSKIYSAPKVHIFLNGILYKYVKFIKGQGRIPLKL